jgi:hypothetical protein
MTRREDVYEAAPGCRPKQVTAAATLVDMLQMTDLPSVFWCISDSGPGAGQITGRISRDYIVNRDERAARELEALHVWALAFDAEVKTLPGLPGETDHAVEFLYGESVRVILHVDVRDRETDR